MNGTRYLWAMFFLFSTNAPIYAQNEFAPEPGDIDMSQFDTGFSNFKITRKITPSSILQTLYSTVHINKLLENDLYAYTAPFNTREIFTYPSLFSWTPYQSQVGLHMFYQQSTNLFPTCCGIQDFLNLFNQDFLQTLNDIEILKSLGVCVPDAIHLFNNARVEQRRVGFLFDAYKQWCSCGFGVELPLYAIARNYNLPLEDRHEIESQLTPLENEKTEDAEWYKYALETRFGLGDLRLTLAYDVYRADNFNLAVGTKITLPTATTFASGFFRGSDFKKRVCRGSFDLTETMEQAEAGNSQAIETFRTLGLQWVNQMGAMLLATDLGNEHRCQLGIYAEPTIRLTNQISAVACARVNWIMPKTVCRFFKETVNPADFADDLFNPEKFPPAEKEERSEAALLFLQNRLINVLFPCQYRAHLKSQLEMQATIGPWIQFTDAWGIFVGYDFWHTTADHFSAIYNGGQSVQSACALRPSATQHKMVIKGTYTQPSDRHTMVLTLGADISMVSHGIGQDFTGVIALEWNF